MVILNEPASGLDPRAARTAKHMTQLVFYDTTVFLSTHILPVIEELATEVGIRYDGELVVEDSPDALKESMKSARKALLNGIFLETTTGNEYESDTERPG